MRLIPTSYTKVVFHLNTGKEVSALFTDEEDDDDLIEDIASRIQGKPSWEQFGDLFVFTGAVSAIEITD